MLQQSVKKFDCVKLLPRSILEVHYMRKINMIHSFLEKLLLM